MKTPINNITQIKYNRDAILNSHIFNFIANKPNSGKMLQQEIQNYNYDYKNRAGEYKLLNDKQLIAHDNLYLNRNMNPHLDQQVKSIVMIGSLAHTIFRLVETIAKSTNS